jgi:2-methylcitrate dehydratase PrpD
MKKWLIEELGSYFSELTFEQLPHEVVEKAKACLLNSLAATLGGYNIDLSKKAISLVKKIDRGNGVSTILIDGTKIGSLNAAFVNSVMSCSRTQNDTHYQTVSHIGEVVPYVCLAVGEERRVNGKDFITALVTGYEVMARVGKGGVPFTISRGFRSTPLFGVIGASAAAGKLLGLDEEEFINALGYAANFSSGLLECWHGGTLEYGFQAGVCSQNGIMASLIAAEGGTATKTTLEGKHGFYNAFAGGLDKIHDICEGLGERYEFLEVVFKKFPGELFNQPVMETFLPLLDEHPLREEEIEKIRVTMDPVAANYPGVRNKGPFQTYLDALISCPFVISTLCIYGKVTFESYARFQDPIIYKLCQKIEVEEGTGNPPMSCSIDVHLKSGEHFWKDLRLSIDSYKLPMSEIVRFFEETSTPLLGKKCAEQLIEKIQFLENDQDITEIGNLLIQPRT